MKQLPVELTALFSPHVLPDRWRMFLTDQNDTDSMIVVWDENGEIAGHLSPPVGRRGNVPWTDVKGVQHVSHNFVRSLNELVSTSITYRTPYPTQ